MAEVKQPEIRSDWQKPFFLVWTGQAFSLLGSQLVQFALIWHLTQQTGSATVLATATLVGMLPQIVIGPLAGSYVDRNNRKRIMIVADSAVALVTLGLVALFALGWVQIWHIYAAMLLRSLGQSFHGPAFTASTSLMVPKRHLARIQGVNHMLNGGLNIVSAPLGALLLGVLPMFGVLAIDVITAALAVATVLPVAVPQPARQTNGNGQETTFWEDFRGGIRYVLSWPGLLIVIVMAMLINFLLTPAGSLSPLLITQHFGQGVLQLGWFEGLSAVGVLVGGLLLSVWGGFKRRIITVMLGLVGLGIPSVVIGLLAPDAFGMALAMIFVTGFMLPIVNGSLGAMMQAAVDPGSQGRIFALTGSLATLMAPLGLLIAGPIADWLGVPAWFLVGGVVCAAMGVIGLFIPALMSIEDGPPKAAEPEAPKLPA